MSQDARIDEPRPPRLRDRRRRNPSSPTCRRLPTSRRGFLAAAGFALAGGARGLHARSGRAGGARSDAARGDRRRGARLWYATTCGGCAAGCGVLVRRATAGRSSSRAIPIIRSRAAACARSGRRRCLASTTAQRLRRPAGGRGSRRLGRRRRGDRRAASTAARDAGGAVRLLTGTVTSPTARARRSTGSSAVPRRRARRLRRALGVGDRSTRTSGRTACASCRATGFERADVIVGVDADFLGTWISPVEFTRGWRAGRAPGAPPRMLVPRAGRVAPVAHRQQGRPTRRAGRRGEIACVLAHAGRSAWPCARPSAPLVEAPAPAPRRRGRARRARRSGCGHARGASARRLRQRRRGVQVLVNCINDLLGAYGRTLDLERPVLPAPGDDARSRRLLAELRGRAVGALVVAGVNPVYELPERSAALAAAPRRRCRWS